jgi:hypothetical protein
MRILFLILFLILILKNVENYGELATGPTQKPTIVGLGNDININNWTSGTNTGMVANGLGGSLKDAQLAPSTHFRLQSGDLNRLCWSDTTTKCAGFRKQLQAGGGGPVWYLYTANAKLPSGITNQSQSYTSPILATVGTLNIPTYLIMSKSTNSPFNSVCSWYKSNRDCTVNASSPCGQTGTWTDTYVISNYVTGQCFDSENNPLTLNPGFTSGTITVNTTVPCSSTNVCTLGYGDGIPAGTLTGMTPSPGWALTATNISDCQLACSRKPTCKIAQFTPGTPGTCTGYSAAGTINPGTTSFVYIHP